MNKKILCFALSATLFALSLSAEALQEPRVPRIGYLTATTADAHSARIEAFREGLRALGYIDGQNIYIEYRYAEGKPDRLPELAAELVRLRVDVIIAASNVAARAASAATKTISIVMTSGGDPVATGLVASLARPGGNVTGLTNIPADLGPKRLELLKEIVPRLTLVAVLPSPSGTARESKEMQAAAPSLQIKLQTLEVRTADDFKKAFEAATKARAGALAVTSDGTGLFIANRNLIVELAIKNRLPAIYPLGSYVSASGLMSYAPNEFELDRRAAVFVDKILKGRKPAN